MHSIKDIVKQLIGKSLDAYNTKYTKVLNTRIDNIVAQAGNDNTEIVDARIDSAGVTHTTLNNRILAETKMNDEQLIEYTGSNISAEDTTQGYLKDVEILGNTIQNEEDLEDIKSVGVLQEDGTYKMSILSCGKNLFDGNEFSPRSEINQYSYTNGILTMSCDSQPHRRIDYILPNTLVHGKRYILTANVKALEYSSNFTPGQYFGYGYYNNGSETYFGDFDTSSNIMTLNFIYKEQGDKSIGFHNDSKDGVTKLQWSNIQLEEGTVATEYEPYQENKCDILLPCQLEKVGDVSDRLYYDDVEKVWCIEKNIKTATIDENNKWLQYVAERNTGKMITSDILDIIPNKLVMSNKLLGLKWSNEPWTTSVDSVAVVNNSSNLYVYLTNVSNETDFKNKLSILKPIIIKYPTTQPQKIVLPLSTQIQLNSFFGTTHVYMESGEVEGTIKCKIPKSLGATVQSLNNKTDILSNRIESIEGLKDSQNMKYETDKGYLVCKETKNGVIDDLKIEGKTLVNLAEQPTNNGSINNQYATISKVTNIKPSTEYTYIIRNNGSETLKLYLNNNGGFDWFELDVEANSTVIGKAETLPSIDGDIWLSLNKAETMEQNLQVVLLEGDHTQNPPSYFEGLMSVGQDVDKIEVLSRKEDGNLLDIKDIKGYFGNSPSYNEGVITGGYGIEIHPNNLFLTKGTYIFSFELDRKTDSVVDYYTIAFCGYNSENILGNIVINTLNNGICTKTITIDRDINVKYIKFDCRSQRANTTVSKICLSKTSNHTYIPHQSDKKQILFYNENGELEPIQELHEWDSIEKHSDNKWYYHKRSGKVMLNGSENWSLPTLETGQVDTNWETETHIAFRTSGLINPKKVFWGHQQTCICNRFKVSILNNTTYTLSDEFIGQNSLGLDIKISKSKLSTQDVEGFKQWLSENNVTVVYQLAEEEVYELAPLHLDSYVNETLILCNSGVISPKMEFSITSHINKLVKAYGERINLLEEKVYQYIVTQNRIQLASTYSTDSVTFKVDYFSLCGDEENYDEDLYNLILNNILVGKDNYNYDKMFTMILDYASWNQISWEQFDILVGLMDMQHNPPVEEEITEDESMEEIPVE